MKPTTRKSVRNLAITATGVDESASLIAHPTCKSVRNSAAKATKSGATTRHSCASDSQVVEEYRDQATKAG
jgi:hypothetical protein